MPPATIRARSAFGHPARAAALASAVLALAGCAVANPVETATVGPVTTPSAPPSPTPAPTPSRTPIPTPTTTPTPTPTPTPTEAPSPTPTGPPTDSRTGRELDEPFTVEGVVVVSRDHPISGRYEPQHPGKHGLEKEVAAALAELIAAAKAEGITVKVRSGYRSYAEQDALLKRKITEYGNEKLARRYNAEPGKSEHQTGLAVDLWDGETWGTGVRRTAAGRWLWKHSREYGFILRYPPGKEEITGYAYEPWHFRYVGTEHSLKFKANHTKTLEEYLGIE